jgi:hypothetical protein
MTDLVDRHHPQAECIRVVLDNLSAHTAATLHDTFEPGEARRILRRLEFHYVPSTASWLNMVEIEIGVLKQQCLARHVAQRETLEREIALWQARRNQAAARIQWMFITERAREKLSRVYRPWQSFVKKRQSSKRLDEPFKFLETRCKGHLNMIGRFLWSAWTFV